ncbi:MAG: MCE family protein [Myxococcales bacterium]|nr:MCE family protein [Myxococcales bacterium]
MKEKSIEVKVGALVLLCTALLVAFIIVLGDMGGGGGFPVFADFPTASDIKPGAPVKIAGVTAGRVIGIEYWGGRKDPKSGQRVTVRILLDVDPGKGQTLHDDAQFFISTQGILGEKYIEVDPGNYERPALKPGAVVHGVPPLRLEVLGQQLSKVAGAVSRLLESNEKTIGEILLHADEAVLTGKKTLEDADKLIVDNRDTVADTLAKLQLAADRAEKLAAALQGAVGDGKAIRRTIAHAEAVAAEVDANTGPLLKDVRAVARNAKGLSERLRDEPTVEVLLGNKGHAKVLAMVDKIGGAVDKAEGAVDDVKAVTKNARDGRGTVGGLLMDNELFMDLKLLLKDLKRHPWKFIWRE